jgi:acetylornithine/N-succinyldiaminopimelate aminotransferase
MEALKLNHILHCHPIIKTDIVSAKNTNLYDKEGKKIIDFEAGIWCTALGHGHERINTVMIEQINNVMHIHNKLTSYISENLAVNLVNLLNFKDGKAVFLSSGSEAVQLSIRLANLVSNRNKILSFSNSYLSAYSNTSAPRDKNQWIELDFCQCSNCTNEKCMSSCSVLKNIDFSEMSAFVLEPAACGRVLFPSSKLVKFLADNVKKNGGLIVINEVTTGFGRTGKWFGYNHYDVDPDIVALGKSLGNGYPISAVVIKKEFADKVESKNFVYAQSHQNDPLGCVVANEVINIFKEDNIIAISEYIGNFFMSELTKVKNGSSIVKDVRGRGLMLAIELTIPNITEISCGKMLERGYFIGTTPSYNVLRFYPALTISENEIISMCEALSEVLKQLETTNR